MKPTDLREQDLVSIPAFRCTATGDPNDNLRGYVEAVTPTGVRVYVPPTDDWDGGDVELPLAEVSLLERLDEDGKVVWCANV